jgi:outer membrane protein assembly factor BamB
MGVILGVVSAIFALAAALATAANITNSLLAQIALGVAIAGAVAFVIGTVRYLLSQRTPKNELRAGQELAVGKFRRSPGGSFSLRLQEGGKLVVIRTGEDKPRWATDTAGTSPKYLTMQKDGNLVLYGRDGSRLWATETDGQGGTRLVIQEDGNLVLRTDGGRAIWASDKAELRAGEELTAGQALRSPGSPGERFRLDLQEDGKLVVLRTDEGKTVWQTDTAGTGANRLVMQHDGNLVLYARDGTPLWTTETDGQGGTRLVIQGDGNLVLRTDEGRAIWASNKAELRAGEKLTVGQGLASPGSPRERFRLDLQEDGNLVVIRTDKGETIWQSGTAGEGAKYLAMQQDGNLVLYAGDGTPLWATDTDGQRGTRVVIQGDGNLVLRTDEGKSIWQSKASPA